MHQTSAGPRWENIAAHYKDQILKGELKPGARLPSENHVAEQYQVCRMTAHRAMNELMRQGLVVRRRRVGTVVAPAPHRKSAKIAVLTFAPDDFPSAGYLRGLRQGIPNDWQMILCDTGEKGDFEAGLLKQMQTEADAIVCFPSSDTVSTEILKEIHEAGTPLVCLDRLPDGLQTDAIVSDNYGATREALNLVVSRGHQRLIHFTDNRLVVSSTRERYQAFLDCLAEAGAPQPDTGVRFFNSFEQPRDEYYGHLSKAVLAVMTDLFRTPQPPTAIFCLQDAYLGAVLEACRHLRLEVPGQLEIVSFNDCPPQFFPVTLPVVRILQKTQEMGRAAAERLSVRLLHGSLPLDVRRIPPQVIDWTEL